MAEVPSADSLTLREAVGQLICPTLFGAQLRDQAYDPEKTAAELATYGWGGYILFHGDRDETRTRVAALQAKSRVPLLVAADMEHGAGQQIAGLSTFPTAMAFGAANDPQATFELGAWTAREALSVGVNWVFAPVADVTNNPLNPIINIRSFGGDSARVAEHVAAFVRGCQSQGALACAKHFPGHGDTATDSHTQLGTLKVDRARLDAVEWPPFKAAIASDVASIMTAHLAVPALGATDRPATLSKAVMTRVLREELGFEGLVVTDALVMGGITRTLDPLEAAVEAIAAGCDVLLMPPDPIATFETLLAAVQDGRLSEERIVQSARRVLAAKRRLQVVAAEAPGRSPEQLAKDVAARAITLAKGPDTLKLPAKTLAIAINDGVEPDRLDAWHQALEAHGITFHTVVSPGTTQEEWMRLATESDRADAIMLGVFSPIRVSKDRSVLPRTITGPLQVITTCRPAVVVSFSSPFLVVQFPMAIGWVLAYGTRPVQIEAALKAVTGQGYPGTLPVTLPEHLPSPTETPVAGRPTGPSFA